MRYSGQSFELGIDIPGHPLEKKLLNDALSKFHCRHENFYGYRMNDRSIEIVNLRLTLKAKREDLPAVDLSRSKKETALSVYKRPVWFEDTGVVETPVYQRGQLSNGMTVEGPTIIEQMDATTVVLPNSQVSVMPSGILLIDLSSIIKKEERFI